MSKNPKPPSRKFPFKAYYQEVREGYYGTPFRANFVGETSRSWILQEVEWWSAKEKISKKDHRIIDTEEEALEIRWLLDNRYDIGKLVQNCCDPVALRRIAHLVGYEK